ncbi:MAG: hypothetical protein K0S30_733, partial [Clostridia bacterium]|jgi:hypothetical protein|nr:hypothetical protein [Clostridia bacterium]
MQEICKRICNVEKFQSVPKSYDYSIDMTHAYGFLNPTFLQKISLLGKDYFDMHVQLMKKTLNEDKVTAPNMDVINTLSSLYVNANNIFTESF